MMIKPPMNQADINWYYENFIKKVKDKTKPLWINYDGSLLLVSLPKN